MIKIKRLQNLIILKHKYLNIQKSEINTLTNELKKCMTIKDKLREIMKNIEKEENTKASILKENNKFNLKILEQILIANNRIKFLKIELNRARNNLGKLIKQKEKIEKKISAEVKNNLDLIEKKYLDSMPPQRNI